MNRRIKGAEVRPTSVHSSRIRRAAQSAANSSATRAKSGRTRRPARAITAIKSRSKASGRVEKIAALGIVRYPLVAMMTLNGLSRQACTREPASGPRSRGTAARSSASAIQ